MRNTTIAVLALSSLMLAGCAMVPLGPTVRVMPGPYKPFEVFQRDQFECTQYADSMVAGQAEAANNRALGATAIGAGLGLALGAATGDGRAATTGAVAGAAVGGTIGAGMSDEANYPIQRRYDIAYAQCMYSKGNQVPGYARPQAYPPPPPPGRNGPPPPPRRG